MTFSEQWTERRTFVLNDDARVRVTLHGTSIVGFIGGRIVAQFDTSGVQQHKIELAARRVLEALKAAQPLTGPQQCVHGQDMGGDCYHCESGDDSMEGVERPGLPLVS